MTSPVHHRSGSFGWRTLLVLLFFAIVGGFLLSAEHRAHTLGILPFLLILLLCPLMHIFMHGGHGGHGGHDPDAPRDAETNDEAAGPVAGAAPSHRH